MREADLIQQQLEELDGRSNELLEAIGELKFRHSLDGNRRNDCDRRSGRDRRVPPLSPERAAGRRTVTSDRRVPLHSRHETLSNQLAAVVARSVALQNWRQTLGLPAAADAVARLEGRGLPRPLLVGSDMEIEDRSRTPTLTASRPSPTHRPDSAG